MKKLMMSVLALLMVSGALAQDQQALAIMKKVKYQTTVPDEYLEMSMKLTNSRGRQLERYIKQYVYRENELRKSLITFTNPSDIRGSGFLSLQNEGREDDNWLYLPALKRSRRISASELTDKFMGSDFTYEDLDDEDLPQFHYTLLEDSQLEGRPCYTIEATAATDAKRRESGYSKRIILVDKAQAVIRKVQYYNAAGEHIKTFEAGDIRQLAGTDKWRSYQMKMHDLQKNHLTTLSFSVIKLNNGFEAAFFSKRSLEAGL